MGDTMRSWLRDAPAWGVSVVINLAILVAMNLIIFTTVSEQQLTTINSIVEETDPNEMVFEATAIDQVGTEGDTSSYTPSMAAAIEQADQQQPKLEEKIEDSLLPDVSIPTEAVAQPSTDLLTTQFESRGSSEMQGGGVEGVMDRITFEIASSLKQNKTMVFWVFDASGSLDERRAAVVKRFENVYKQLESNGDTEGLYTVAASFGEGANLLTEQPTTDIDELKKSIAKIETDASGVENVFTVVGLLIDKFKKWNRSEGPWNRLVFIVTDERGDDAEQYMESVITEAKRFRFRCFVVGNAAVFGQKLGYHKYVAPENGQTYYLEVDQGPESAFPQRIDMGFWGAGDSRLNRMSSGFGPYALTRLCAETQGMFLVTQDTDGVNYDPAVMRNYMPDYRPVRTIEEEIRKNPAMASLVEAASRALIARINLPATRFDAPNDNVLREQLTNAQRPFAELDYKLKELHQLLDAGSKGRAQVKDPRWQASFDLALGRIMAMRVRAFGYNSMSANMKSSPKSFENKDSNEWFLDPSDEIATGPKMRAMAEQAKSLLEGVVQQHPGTPWATLATKELAQPFGWKWRESANERLRAMSDPDSPEARVLFEEEERQRQERAKAVRPKLPKL